MARLRKDIACGSDDYLASVVLETLRIRTVVPTAMRKLARPTVLGGYAVPAGWLVTPAIPLLHADPECWPDSGVFRPERFRGEVLDRCSIGMDAVRRWSADVHRAAPGRPGAEDRTSRSPDAGRLGPRRPADQTPSNLLLDAGALQTCPANRHGTAGTRVMPTIAKLLRLRLLGVTVATALIGTVSVRSSPSWHIALVLVVAILFHIASYVLNDVADLEIDRANPNRARSPLVASEVRLRIAVPIGVTAVVAAFAVDRVVAGGFGIRTLALAVAFAGLIGYDFAGKRVPSSAPHRRDPGSRLGRARLVRGARRRRALTDVIPASPGIFCWPSRSSTACTARCGMWRRTSGQRPAPQQSCSVPVRGQPTDRWSAGHFPRTPGPFRAADRDRGDECRRERSARSGGLVDGRYRGRPHRRRLLSTALDAEPAGSVLAQAHGRRAYRRGVRRGRLFRRGEVRPAAGPVCAVRLRPALAAGLMAAHCGHDAGPAHRSSELIAIRSLMAMTTPP